MSFVLGTILCLIAVFCLIGAGGTAYQVGVPRKPLTESQAGARILLALAYVIVFVWAAVLLFTR